MKWQYKPISLPSSVKDRENMLSEMGLNGWELVGFEQGLAFFKRPLAVEEVIRPIEATVTFTHPDLTKPDAPVQKLSHKKK